MGVNDFTIYDYIRRNAQLYGERDSIVFNDIRLTHREYKARCDRLAAGLKRSGVERGDRLGVLAHNSDEFMILYGAAAKIGAIILAVNWRFQPDEVEYVFRDCAPKFIFAGPDYRDVVKETAPRVVSIQRCYTIGGGEASDGFDAFGELYTGDGADNEDDVPAGAGYVIIHTAAVEGQPRGALLSQANIIYANLAMMAHMGINPGDCHICILPLFHIAGLSLSMTVMHAGGKNVIVERFDPELTLRLIEKEKGTTFFNFAPILKMLLDKYDEGTYDLSSLRYISGLDTPETIKRFQETLPHVQYRSAFAQTEAMAVTSGLFQERPGSAGQPLHFSRVALFDEYDREVPTGSVGEICVKSPTVFLGYWGREEDTARTFRHGWHHTGDMGRFDEDGFLWYVKRKAQKELIKPGGENVYPAEVEKAILEHEDVAEVCVIGVPDEEWGEAIKAVCALKPGKTLEPRVLIDFVAARIARYKKPKHVIFVDSLPKTAAGETDREKIKKDHNSKY